MGGEGGDVGINLESASVQPVVSLTIVSYTTKSLLFGLIVKTRVLKDLTNYKILMAC